MGYFTFYAASQWLKSPPRRRGRYLPALLTYAARPGTTRPSRTAANGSIAAPWLPVLGALLIPALWLARQRRERGPGRRRRDHSRDLSDDPGTHPRLPAVVVKGWPADRPSGLVSPSLFGYFFGTVLHVKSLIRERGNTRIERGSLIWHANWAAVSILLWEGPLWLSWAALFVLAVARTVVLARLARSRPVRPAAIGVLEVVLSGFALVCALLTAAPD